MVVAKPIKRESKIDITALINKGGTIATEKPVIKKEKKILLAIPGGIADNIQKAIQAKQEKTGIKVWVTPWILEAIVEKLNKN